MAGSSPHHVRWPGPFGLSLAAAGALRRCSDGGGLQGSAGNGLAQKERSWDGTPMEHHGKNHGKPWKNHGKSWKTQGKTMEHHVELI